MKIFKTILWLFFIYGYTEVNRPEVSFEVEKSRIWTIWAYELFENEKLSDWTREEWW